MGSEQDALACILPAVLSRLEASSLQLAIDGAKRTARAYRGEDKWSNAQSLLNAALDCAQRAAPSGLDLVAWEQMVTDIVNTFCELYRYALRDPGCLQFVLDDFYQLSQRGLPSSTVHIVRHYTEAARIFDPWSTTENCDGLLSALKANDFTATLVELTRLRSSCTPNRAMNEAL
ncbi:hypothetical protein BJX64DRAFT_258397 [Aspergillus heterothallicus]